MFLDQIYYKDETACSLKFNNKLQFIFGKRGNIEKVSDLDVKNYTTLYPSFECRISNQVVISGETSYGGASFIGFKTKNNTSFEWLMHISNLNNVQKMWIIGSDIHIKTDLVYPNGIEFIIPSKSPELIRSKSIFQEDSL